MRRAVVVPLADVALVSGMLVHCCESAWRSLKPRPGHTWPGRGGGQGGQLRAEVVQPLPHDPKAFAQGLEMTRRHAGGEHRRGRTVLGPGGAARRILWPSAPSCPGRSFGEGTCTARPAATAGRAGRLCLGADQHPVLCAVPTLVRSQTSRGHTSPPSRAGSGPPAGSAWCGPCCMRDGAAHPAPPHTQANGYPFAMVAAGTAIGLIHPAVERDTMDARRGRPGPLPGRTLLGPVSPAASRPAGDEQRLLTAHFPRPREHS
jgi:hypothetical protein